MATWRMLLSLLVICLFFSSPAGSVEKVLSLHFFYAENCPKCLEEKPIIESLQQRYPQLIAKYHDVWLERESYELMELVAESQGVDFASTPVTAIGHQVWFGYQAGLERELERAVQYCLASRCDDLVAKLQSGEAGTADAPLDPPDTSSLPIDPQQYSLPAFTLILGLLDSFNPCAFFVLLFLLSLMVHTHSRQRMFLVGGIFILFSGGIYFLFMAAWLNLFLIAGQLPLLTTLAGLIALTIAVLNIKDHFFLKQGPSLSITESAKPRLITRMRNLLKSDRLWPLLLGTSVLAVVANTYELLCTAGFPMVYTRVLTMRELPEWSYYAYLGLYNLAYVLPLLLIVSIFSLTLGGHKLSEFEGRALKLISGVMMLCLGLILLFKPLLLQNLYAVAALLICSLLIAGTMILWEKRHQPQTHH